MQESHYFQNSTQESDDPLDNDLELQNELAEMFLDECPRLLAEMHRGMLRQDGPALRIAAHTLKGASGVFDAQAAYVCAYRMECIGKDNDWGNVDSAWDAVNVEMSRLSTVLSRQISLWKNQQQ